MNTELHQFVSTIIARCKSVADPERAKGQSAYMKHNFQFFGITGPVRKEIFKATWRDYPIKTEPELCEIIMQLWSLPQRELQYCAYETARKYKKLWSPDFFNTLEKIIVSKSWWDSIDPLGSNLMGPLLQLFPQLTSHMDIWITDENMWKRRVALIFQLKYKEKTDQKKLFRYITLTSHEKEFFIRKAIGWTLREYSKTNPSAVRLFITEYRNSLSGLSIREGSKYI